MCTLHRCSSTEVLLVLLVLLHNNNNGPPFATSQDCWSIGNATLSSARGFLASASIGNLALFAGGGMMYPVQTTTDVVDIFYMSSGSLVWSTATLSKSRYSLTSTSIGNLVLFAGG